MDFRSTNTLYQKTDTFYCHTCMHKQKGSRLRHSDIWIRILKWLRLFESLRAHQTGALRLHMSKPMLVSSEQGNECADKLAKEGVDLWFKLMEQAAPLHWFHTTFDLCWGNRRPR